jgi:hypothetical protein
MNSQGTHTVHLVHCVLWCASCVMCAMRAVSHLCACVTEIKPDVHAGWRPALTATESDTDCAAAPAPFCAVRSVSGAVPQQWQAKSLYNAALSHARWKAEAPCQLQSSRFHERPRHPCGGADRSALARAVHCHTADTWPTTCHPACSGGQTSKTTSTSAERRPHSPVAAP